MVNLLISHLMYNKLFKLFSKDNSVFTDLRSDKKKDRKLLMLVNIISTYTSKLASRHKDYLEQNINDIMRAVYTLNWIIALYVLY